MYKIKNKINSWFSKIFKSDKRNNFKSDERNNIFLTTEDLYFTIDGDGWNGKIYPKYSYKDFNKNEGFLSFLKLGSRFQLYFNGKIISEANLMVNSFELGKTTLQFGRISSNNAFWGEKPIGGMTFLVASIIYIMLNDNEFMHRDIEVSLEIHMDAKRLLEEKNIDVYYHIFRTPKINFNHEDTYRRYIFETINRNSDIDYFKELLSLKENSIMNAMRS